MNARDAALIRLAQAQLPHWPDDALGTLDPDDTAPTDPRDRALADAIYLAVVRRLRLLKFLIEHHSGRDIRKIDPAVQMILAVALAQLRDLPRIPESAAVNEAVEQTRRFDQRGAATFVNAVLRNAVRSPWIAPATIDAEFAISILESHPPDVVARMRQLLGDDGALALARHHNRIPPLVLRLAPGTTAQSIAAAAGEGEIAEHAEPGFAVASGLSRAALSRLAESGAAQVQDVTSARVVRDAPVAPGLRVLDRCAGVGTKTLQLAAAVGPTGTVIAVEPDGRRCRVLAQSLAARAMTHVQIVQDQRLPAHLAGDGFDLVLADVPCSNSGVMARRPEARYRQSDESLASLRKLQRGIASDSAELTRPGGVLIYATCSIWPEENDGIVDWLLSRRKDFARQASQTALPSAAHPDPQWHDGGFFARLVRNR